MKKKLLIAVGSLLALACAVTVPVLKSKGFFSDGNAEKYSVASTPADPGSTIKGKTVIFLGSSVTFGAASKEESFVEFLEKKDGIIPVKEAVSGTTLVDEDESSYISRMKAIDKNIKADAFVCQLSTNDATKKKEIGEASLTDDTDSFDTSTVAGAIEYIISYAKSTWNCPVIFYTGTRYDSERYEQLVHLLLKIKEKTGIEVIDLWNNDMNDIDPKQYGIYMADGIHPTRAGYRDWWLPEFEKALTSILK